MDLKKAIEDDHESIRKGIERMLEHSALELESVSGKLPEIIDTLDCAKLPEYQQALNAIREYKEAVIKEFDRIYQEGHKAEEIA